MGAYWAACVLQRIKHAFNCGFATFRIKRIVTIQVAGVRIQNLEFRILEVKGQEGALTRLHILNSGF